MRTIPVWISIAAIAAATQVAEAKPKKAGKTKKEPTKAQTIKAHMNRATRAHKAGKFEVALTELQAAYDLDPQPKLLFAIAQVQQKLDRCDGAIDNYEKFLATTKDKQKQAIVKQAIDSCKTKLAAAPPAPPPADKVASSDGVFRDSKPEEPVATATTPPPATETPPASAATETPPAPAEPPAASTPAPEDSPLPGPSDEPPPAHKAWYKDTLGDALVIGGIAAGIGSVLMYSNARGDLDSAEKAPTLADYDVLVSQAHDRRTYAIILGGASGALLVGGILRYSLHDSKESKKVAIVPTTGGGLITWGGGF